MRSNGRPLEGSATSATASTYCGIVLFVAFGIVLGPARAAALSTVEHWLVVWACMLIVTLVSFTTFRLIETPAMASVDRVNARFGPTPGSAQTPPHVT